MQSVCIPLLNVMTQLLRRVEVRRNPDLNSSKQQVIIMPLRHNIYLSRGGKN